MKSKIDLKWILVSLIFLGLITLLFSAVAISGNVIVHQRLWISSLVFFGLAALILIVMLIDDHLTHKGLNKEERTALMYFSSHDVVSAETFSLMHGRDVYLSLLRKGLIENCFKEHRQEVYCRLSDKGVDISERLLRDSKH